MAATLCLLMLLPQVSKTEVTDLLRKLDADRFAERNSATQQLSEMGPAVFGELVKAARESGSREVQERALKILGDHFKNGDTSIRSAAEKSLQEVASQDSQAGRRAKEMLKPEAEQLAEVAAAQRLQMQRLQIAQMQARIAGQRQIQLGRMQVVPRALPGNVNRTIQISTKGRKIKIEVANGKIKMEIEETDKNGKKVSKKYEAANEAELKKKHPEAFKEYERYAGQRRAVIVPPNIVPGRAMPARRIAPAPPNLPEATRQRILDSIKASQERLAKDEAKYKQSLKGEELERALQSLQKRRTALEESRKRYEVKKEG